MSSLGQLPAAQIAKHSYNDIDISYTNVLKLCRQGWKLLRFDVNLYSNIPHDLGVEAIVY